MSNKLIGRKEERSLLENALRSKEAEMVAVVGRRRVGKTFLISSVYRDNIVFEMTGVQDGSLKSQLENFTDQLSFFAKPSLPIAAPRSWQEAFKILREFLQNLDLKEKKVLFFDELPWLAGPKSGFVQAFGYFWNNWASRQNLVIVVCGSAASWMLKRIINDSGGLHNRITRRIYLEPFTLSETEAYLRSREIHFDRYQLVQIYMAMGGVPHYLKEIDGAKSAIQNIDYICFSRKGLLADEFNRLYPALFTNAEEHISVIRALGRKQNGMTRNEIQESTRITNGGGLTKTLEELIVSGFVAEYFPFGKKKKEKIYRLIDEYSLFYIQFVEENRYQGGNPWQHLSQSQAYKSWSGYAFEGICIKHIEQIKQALGISGIYSNASSFYKKGTGLEQGIQIDLVLDRNDHTINLFEIKYYNKPFSIDQEYADKLRNTMWRFQEYTQSRKQIQWMLISPYGMTPNAHSIGLVSKALNLNDLF